MSSNLSIQAIQDWLKQNKTASIQLYNEHQNVVIDKLHYRDLSDYDYDLGVYFENLFERMGCEYISIQKKRKNGNNRIDAGSQRLKVTPKPKTSVVESGAKNVANASHVGSTQKQQNYNPMQHQQQNELGMYGANPTMVSHLIKSERYEEQKQRAEKAEKAYEMLRDEFDSKLKTHRNKIEAEKDDLKTKYEDKIEALKQKLDDEREKLRNIEKPDFVDKLAGVLANPAIAERIMGGGGGQAQQENPGLSGTQNLSEKAQYVIGNIIKNTPDDDILDRLILLVQEYKKGNETFINAMEAQYNLLNKQQQTA